MSWQTCPVCKGKGKIDTLKGVEQCNVCNGKGIINELSGNPPNENENINESDLSLGNYLKEKNRFLDL